MRPNPMIAPRSGSTGITDSNSGRQRTAMARMACDRLDTLPVPPVQKTPFPFPPVYSRQSPARRRRVFWKEFMARSAIKCDFIPTSAFPPVQKGQRKLCPPVFFLIGIRQKKKKKIFGREASDFFSLFRFFSMILEIAENSRKAGEKKRKNN